MYMSKWRQGRLLDPARFRGESGAAAVEFALVAPILLVALIGILTYGIYFGVASSVQQLATDAARASVAGLNDQERADIARQHVSVESPSYILIDSRRVTVAADAVSGNPNLFQVAVRYDASGLPIYVFEKLVPMPPRTITRTSVIHRGGY